MLPGIGPDDVADMRPRDLLGAEMLFEKMHPVAD